MLRCRDMFGQSSKTVPKSGLLPRPVGVNARKSLDQIFQITVIGKYVSKFGWDLFSDFRHYTSKKERRKKEKKRKKKKEKNQSGKT